MQMSRPSTGNSGTGPGGGGARPTHIALPAGHFQSGGSPLQTPTPLAGGAASPASPRHSFLGFMRGRGRSNTLSNVNSAAAGAPSSPSLERGNPLTAPASRGGSSREGSTGPHGGGGGGAGREGNAGASTTAAGTVTRSISTPLSGGLSAPSTAATATGTPAPRSGPGGGVGLNINNPVPVILPAAAQGSSLASTSTSQTPSKTYRIRLVPHLESQRSLAFDPVVRELVPIVVPPGVQPAIAAQSFIGAGPTVNGRLPALILKIGRFTDKSNPPALPIPGDSSASGTAGSSTIGPNGIVNGNGAGPSASLAIAGGGGDVTSGKAAFKSKVVSRSHAEIWCEPGGKFYIRDTASSSGTFLNHIRLSSPNTESRPTMLNDGDVLQLGVDYQGGTEEMFRCVKMRVEVGREWQRGANEFNTNALKQLKALGGAPESKSKSSAEATPSKKAKASVTDCCICLFSVTVCQSLFIAPCSHVFHYKCIRPLLLQHHPGFSCPLCRTFANLEEDVETEDAWEIASRRASIISRKPSNHSIRLPSASQADPAPSSPGAGPSGQPSTGISLGVSGAAASVDELLAAPSAEGGEASTAEDEDQTNGTGRGMIGSSALLRQTTAVAHPASGVAGETGDVTVDVPSMVREDEDEDIEGADRFLTAETNASNSPGLHHENQPTSVPVPIGTLSLRDGNGHDHGQGNSDFDVATPMNEHFLSTLVGGAVGAAPGIDQRLALAEEIGSSDHGHAETNGNSNEARREADMVYT
ncbi:hypothetical protein I316_05572 [Kwoniella heveanensis BCC8398]|uniref:Cytoplasmic protein n=1 Tax=Kwoniella heveanensis BCC8398 TaxID=1296120 RepID=A0A1B9GNR9_9TREE|nr:hypothetical protein I316_05572 [Kwoniella heveanensis BCC8398]